MGDRSAPVPADPRGVPAAVRQAVRAVLLEPGGAVLLMCVAEPRSGDRWWFTPGGGIDPGEDEITALLRELDEELGLHIPADVVGPPLWRRHARFVWNGRPARQDETFYLVEMDRFTPERCEDGDPDVGVQEAEPGWWAPDDLRATGERVVPAGLAGLLDRLARDGPPGAPIRLDH